MATAATGCGPQMSLIVRPSPLSSVEDAYYSQLPALLTTYVE